MAPKDSYFTSIMEAVGISENSSDKHSSSTPERSSSDAMWEGAQVAASGIAEGASSAADQLKRSASVASTAASEAVNSEPGQKMAEGAHEIAEGVADSVRVAGAAISEVAHSEAGESVKRGASEMAEGAAELVSEAIEVIRTTTNEYAKGECSSRVKSASTADYCLNDFSSAAAEANIGVGTVGIDYTEDYAEINTHEVAANVSDAMSSTTSALSHGISSISNYITGHDSQDSSAGGQEQEGSSQKETVETICIGSGPAYEFENGEPTDLDNSGVTDARVEGEKNDTPESVSEEESQETEVPEIPKLM